LPDYQSRIKALLFSPLQNGGIEGVVHGAGSAENPEVFAFGGADHGMLILPAQLNNPVVTPERPEKENLQLCIAGTALQAALLKPVGVKLSIIRSNGANSTGLVIAGKFFLIGSLVIKSRGFSLSSGLRSISSVTTQ